MLYSVEKIAEILGVSKVTVYRKLKLPDVKPHIVMKNNKSFIEEDGIEVIKNSLNVVSEINYKDTEQDADVEISTDSEELQNVKETLINTLQAEVEYLREQLKDKETFYRSQLQEKDTHINNKDRQLENMQSLMQNEQQLHLKSKLLEEARVKEVDNMLSIVRERMEERKKSNKGFFDWFKKHTD